MDRREFIDRLFARAKERAGDAPDFACEACFGSSESFEVQVKNGETKTTGDLPLGDYTVSETSHIEIDDYAFDRVDLSAQNVTIGSDNQTVSVSATLRSSSGVLTHSAVSG